MVKQGVPVWIHCMEELGTLHGISKLCKPGAVSRTAEVRGVLESHQDRCNVKGDGPAILIGISIKEHGNGDDLRADCSGFTDFRRSSYRRKRIGFSLIIKGIVEVWNRSGAALPDSHLGGV